MPKVHRTFVPESAFQGSFDAEKQTWSEFGWIPVACRGEKLLMTTGGSADVASSGTAFLSIPGGSVRLCAHAGACLWFTVRIICYSSNLAYPGFVGLLAARSCVITSGTLGSFTAETPARLPPISCSVNCCLLYLHSSPLKALSISVNHIQQWVKWSWISPKWGVIINMTAK